MSGYSPLEVATGRRPPDLLDVETSNPEQLSLEELPEDRTATQLRTIAMKAHLETRQSADLKKDLARRVMPSDGPYAKGEKVFVWHKDDNKKKRQSVWMRGTVVSQEGAMPTVFLRVNQSKVRRDHDEWHDVQIPHLEGHPSLDKSGSSTDEVDNANASLVSEHEVCCHLCCDKDPVDCVEVLRGIGAYLSHQGKLVAPAVDLQFTNKKSLTVYSCSLEEPSQVRFIPCHFACHYS